MSGTPGREDVAPFVLAVVLVTLAACSRDERRAGDDASVPATTPPAAMSAPPSGTAQVTGRTIYGGAAPQPRLVRMDADPYCVKANEGGARQASVRVAQDGGLADVFVYVSKGLDAYSYAPSAEPEVLDQTGCTYVPKVVGLQVGQPLEIRNSDQTLHNVHAMAETSEGFNIGMPHKGMSAVRKFSTPEVLVRIKCDVHPWMAAYAGVVTHPFYAVTEADGSYELAGLPAGEYTISAVHYELGARTENVTIAEGASAKVDFSFSD